MKLRKSLVRFSIFIVAIVLLSCAAYYYRIAAIRDRPILPVGFEHTDHRKFACTDCHHNFIDDTGSGTCYSCHKHTPSINTEIEKMFHHLCRNCHVDKRIKGDESGPLRSCTKCHKSERDHYGTIWGKKVSRAN